MTVTLPLRLLLFAVSLGALTLGVNLAIVTWLIRDAQHQTAIKPSQTEVGDLVGILKESAKFTSSIGTMPEALIRNRNKYSRALDCDNFPADGRFYAVDHPRQQGANPPGMAWSGGPPGPTSVAVSAGAICQRRPRVAWGYAERYEGRTYLAARFIDPAADPTRQAIAATLVIFSLFAVAALIIFRAVHLRQMQAVNQLTATLDRFDQSNFQLRANESLGSSEIRQLSLHVNRMIDRIQRMSANLSSVSMHIAHDLRTPLTVMALQLDRLSHAARKGGDLQSLIGKAREQVQAVTRRCVQLLDITRVETLGGASFTTIELASVLSRLIDEMFEDIAGERGIVIDVRVSGPVSIIGNPGLIERAMANLLQNAVKFADPGSTIAAELRQETRRAVFAVVDRGAIVPFERLATIFDPGESSSVNEGGGHGLGLPFVRAVARRHGGDVAAMPLPAGMCFEIWFATSDGAP